MVGETLPGEHEGVREHDGVFEFIGACVASERWVFLCVCLFVVVVVAREIDMGVHVLYIQMHRMSTPTRWSSWTCTRVGAARAGRCIRN